MHVANLLSLFLIFLPAFLANASPVVAKNIPGIRSLSWPIHAEWFGKNKTVRGIITGVLTGIITGIVLYFLRHNFVRYLPDYTSIYNLYSSIGWAMFIGWILALGALLGDLIESFIKRRLGIKPGAMFQPWDGIDYMVGAMCVVLPWYNVHILGMLFLLVIGPILSLVANSIAYMIGWKECWY